MRELRTTIKKCSKCPHFHWEPDNSCGNSEGDASCKEQGNRYIGDWKHVKAFPKWCRLKKIDPKPERYMKREVNLKKMLEVAEAIVSLLKNPKPKEKSWNHVLNSLLLEQLRMKGYGWIYADQLITIGTENPRE